ncbi:phosphomevalonate kinase [Streptomyces cellulosae]
MPRPVTARAPGKLMIAGEFAVLTPGQPAIIASVDRYVTVTASACADEAHDIEIDSDLMQGCVALREKDACLVRVDSPEQDPRAGRLAPLVSVAEQVRALCVDLGLAPVRARLAVRSTLHEDGVKIGLGPSGAVMAAAVRALTEFAGLPLRAEARLHLGLLACAVVDPAPSGGDVAASTWQRWILYRPPDRDALLLLLRHCGVLAALQAPWPGLSVRALPRPTTVSVLTGWTGRPADTGDRVGRLRAHPWWNSVRHWAFQRTSAQVVSDLGLALQKDAPGMLIDAVARAHTLLTELDRDSALGILTPALSALCRAAYAAGGAAKASGAGGGDCGIAVLPASTVPAGCTSSGGAAASSHCPSTSPPYRTCRRLRTPGRC